MNSYNTNVSEQELADSRDYTTEEFNIAIKALGIALTVGISYSEALIAVAKITPNDRLRDLLVYLDGSNRPMHKVLKVNHSGQIPEIFFLACEYGERINKLGEMLLMYAKDSGVPDHVLADQIGWDEGLRSFLKDIADEMANENSGIPAYRQQPRRFLDALLILRQLSGQKLVIEKIRDGRGVADALAETELFDSFSLAVIKAAEERDIQAQEAGKESIYLCKAFELLAIT